LQRLRVHHLQDLSYLLDFAEFEPLWFAVFGSSMFNLLRGASVGPA